MKPPKAAARIDRPFPTLMLELEARATWNGPVCGVDEAGRGPWAGPVSAAAVILNPDDLPPGIDDSKALTEKRRAALEPEIKARALAWGVGFASVEEIEELNILHATGLAMCRAIEALSIKPAIASIARHIASPVAPRMFSSSISRAEAKPTPQAIARALISGSSAIRRFSVRALESSMPGGRSSGFRITAPAETGPAHGPRPASSTPQT